MVVRKWPKINTTKNFNAGAIITTLKRQLLAQKTHPTTNRSSTSVHPFFFAFTQPQNPTLYNVFQSARRPKVPVPTAVSTSPYSRSSLDPHDAAFQTAYQSV